MDRVDAGESVTAEFERRYNARAAVPEFREIFAGWASRSQRVRETWPRQQLDVAYGSRPTDRLDLFWPRKEPSAIVVYLHGGYWFSLDKSDASLVVPALAGRDVAVAVVNYALCPAVSIADIVEQVTRSVQWLYRRAPDLGFPRNRLFVCGHSAGAHLATSVVTQDWRKRSLRLPNQCVRGVIAISGLYDLRPLVRVPSVNVHTRLDETAAAQASPALARPHGRPWVITAVGDSENDGFLEQSGILAAAWGRSIRSSVLCPGRNHFTVLEELIDEDGRIARATRDLIREAGDEDRFGDE